jgi:hypothetical protein
MKEQTADERLAWLLRDLCTQLGYSMAVRDPARFRRLVALGAEVFADAVLVAEGLDPELDKQLRRSVREFVSERFARWSSRDG